MRRFLTIHWCAFILTCFVGLSAVALSTPTAQAGPWDLTSQSSVGDLAGDGVQTPQQGGGDPDIPDNGVKGSLGSGSCTPHATSTLRPVGDGGTWDRVWWWRIQVVLQVLRQQLSSF